VTRGSTGPLRAVRDNGARLVGWCRRHPVATAAVIYALLAIALFSEALLPGRTLSSSDFYFLLNPWVGVQPHDFGLASNAELQDATAQYQPFVQYTRAALPDIPLWNPHVMGGRPFLANGQSAIFSPFSLPAYILPFWRSLAWIAILKVFVASFGSFLLGRELRMRFAGALLVGLVFGFGLFFVEWLSWPLSSVWAWLPWLLLLTERLVRRPGPLPGAGLAVLVALQYFGGHPESSFHTLAAVGAFFVLRLVQARRAGDAPSLRRPIVAFAGAMVGGAALAAVAIVPFAELLRHSNDIDVRTEPGRLYKRALAGLFSPDWFGRPTHTAFEGLLVQRAFYAGALPLMLAAAALVVRPKAERIAIAAFGAVAMFVTVGVTPFFQAVTALPGFNVVHNTRLPILYMMCVALLAGWGLDDLKSGITSLNRRRVVLWLCAAIFAIPLAWIAIVQPSPSQLGRAIEAAYGFANPPRPQAPNLQSEINLVRWAALIVWVTVAGAALLLVTGRLRSKLAPAAFAGLAITLVVIDLFHADMGQNTAIKERFATQPATGAIRYLQSRTPARFAGISHPNEIVTLPANLAMRYGLYDARGYDYPVEKRYDRIWRREVAPFPGYDPPNTLAPPNERTLRVLSLLSASDLIEGPKDPPIRLPGVRLVYKGPDAQVYANDRALPRAFVVGTQRVVPGEQAALNAVTSPSFNGRRVAITERPVAGVSTGPTGAGPAGGARIVVNERERVVVRARVDRPGLMVLTDSYFPGWKAKVDGRDVPVERVDYMLRGVRLTLGAHEVEFRYEPASFRIGWIVSAVALAGLLLTVVLGLRARRRRRRAGATSA
jgi:membrane protein YfhO